MSFISTSSGEEYYWDNDVDWRTDEEEEGSRGDEDGGEEEGAGDQGGSPEIDSDIGGEMLFSRFGRRLKKTKFFGI